jgi:peptidoglycan-associated lipoprotein
MKLRNTFLQLAIVAMLSVFYGCPNKGDMKSANENFNKKEFAAALDAYKNVYGDKEVSKEDKKEAAFRIAECYRMKSDFKNAETWYKKALKAGFKDPTCQYRYAEALKNNQNYAQAIIEMKEYKKLVSNDPRADRMITGCEDALKWKNQKTRYLVENVKELNTKFSDFAPAYYKNNALYITTDREAGKSKDDYMWTGNKHVDLWYSELKKKKLSAPIFLEGLVNSPFNDGVCCFDKKGTTMYYTQCNGRKGDGRGCKIWFTTLKGKEWEEPQLMPFCANPNDTFTYGHPSLSEDGNILYFTSDKPGGLGGKDLYFSNFVKKSKTWGDPINLGDSVNTEADEMFPFIHPDGTLYFASNGHVGLGGLDIFVTKGQGTNWSTPKNMRSPLNSGADDFAFICDNTKENGFFSSNREGGRGQDDIWRFSMTPLVFTISGVVRDDSTKEILPGSKVVMTNSYDTTRMIAITDANGYYKFTLRANTDYELIASKEDYYDSRLESQTTKGLEVSTDLIQDFTLKQFTYEFIKVEGIYYDLDQARIRPDAALILDSLVMTLNKYPRLVIELGSHTDCRADSAYNIRLSQARSDSAVAYLVMKGVDPERLVAKGYGENMLAVEKCKCDKSDPGNKICSEEEHQLNRRTTVRILSTKFRSRNTPPEPPPAPSPKNKNNSRPPGGR